MKKKMIVDGNEACSYSSYYFTEIAGIYPITPSSPMAEHLEEWSNQGRTNLYGDTVKVVEMQSEAGAAGMVHGSLQAGCLTSTYTASQGLLLMIPNMYKIAGEMLPCTMHVAARSLSTHALSILGDHQDIYAARSTGFCMLASSSVQDTAYLSAIAHLSSIQASLPFLHFFDGFRTSHELQKIEVLEYQDYETLLDQEALARFHSRALNPNHPVIRGTTQNDDIYFQATEARNIYYEKVPDIVNYYMEKINEKAQTNYQPFCYYGSKQAKKIIVAMGSVCETIKEVIDTCHNPEYGLIEVHLYRPFSEAYFMKVLPDTVEKIAVLDRTKETGSREPLYLDVTHVIKGKPISIVGGRYGLSSKNTTPEQIKAVYYMLDHQLKDDFTIGIEDDVTHLSLPIIEETRVPQGKEFLIYGYGSDGMVSASKSLIHLVGEVTEQYVQGYFQYDSKKSGGVTVCHLRFSNEKIRSTYYVSHPSLIVVTKDSYLSEFDCYRNIAENGIFILNTTKSEEESIALFPEEMKQLFQERHVTIYLINAYALARKIGLQNKISTILESVIVFVTKLLDYEVAKEKMKVYVKEKFFKKGKEAIEANLLAIDFALQYLQKIELANVKKGDNAEVTTNGVYQSMTKRLGDKLPTSAFLPYVDGTFTCGTSKLEKRAISDIVPRWLNENCIQCNQCSIVCPHGVIRPFLLSEKEYEEAPEWVQKRLLKALGYPNYYYTVAISIQNCTGCGVCVKTCPGKKGEKALMFETLTTEKREGEQRFFDYLVTHVAEKREIEPKNVRDSQFRTPKFCYSGACAGCGETAYIKLLTQLFGEQLIIANATGCSSIYGGSMPSMPYTVPWASSLFEDNAEYGYGMEIANKTIRIRLREEMKKHLDNPNGIWFQKFIDHMDDPVITKEVYDKLDDKTLPKSIKKWKEYIQSRVVFAIGGDGWAYDIGFSGIDHVLASNDNINILVLDSQVYSNTGGQSSKASPIGSIASFASHGKRTSKKDLARIALSYPNAYVASVNLGFNSMQLIKAFKEAVAHPGPSIIIAYTPCISHGIKGGLENSIEMEKLATTCGYYPIFRYLPSERKFYLDSKHVNFDLYEDFLNLQTRYFMLKAIAPDKADQLLQKNKTEAIVRYTYYQSLETEN